MDRKIFISYSSKDKPLAIKLRDDLVKYGFHVWFDDNEILVGHNLIDKVYSGIFESDYLIILLSINSISSKWVSEELTTAKMREIEENRIIILPAKLDDCILPNSLLNKKYIDLSVSWDNGVCQINNSLDKFSRERNAYNVDLDYNLRKKVKQICEEYNVIALFDRIIDNLEYCDNCKKQLGVCTSYEFKSDSGDSYYEVGYLCANCGYIWTDYPDMANFHI